MIQEIVRVATREDQDEIMRLLTCMHAEGGIMPLDEMAAKKTFDLAFNRQGGIIGVIGIPGDIKAMIFLLMSRFWYSRQYHLEELFNFVRPDVRNSAGNSKDGYASRLIEFAKRCSDEIGLPLTIGILTNQRMEGKVRLYRRSLGVPAGAWFVHMPQGMGWQNESNEEFWKEPFPRRGRVASGKDLRRMRAVG